MKEDAAKLPDHGKAPADASWQGAGAESSSRHHYLFGHVALRGIFFENPRMFLQTLEMFGEKLLVRLWHETGRHLHDGQASAPPALATGLAYSIRELRPKLNAVIVVLPPPQRPTEAYFVAMLMPLAKADLKPRYLTLERSVHDDEPGTMLGEWIGDRHYQLGPGPVSNLGSFVACLTTLTQEPSPSG